MASSFIQLHIQYMIRSFIPALIGSISFLCITGCARVSDEELPFALQEKAVVFSIICPNIAPSVSLCKTTVGGQANDTVYYPSARVYMWENPAHKTELTRQSSTRAIYTDSQNQLTIERGKTYYLQVIIGNDSLNAHTTVPLATARIVDGTYQLIDTLSESGYLRGTFTANLQNAAEQSCLLVADNHFIAEDKGTFLGSNKLTDQFSIADNTQNIGMKLYTLDSYLASYWAERAISVRQMHYSGDLSVFIGTFNGILPRYSNIEHGFGLFGSYITDTKTIGITQP
ncbi:MAG: hypothetical protein RIS29_242 [Bacteroidota bacterium]|jgi:hypothetical protein